MPKWRVLEVEFLRELRCEVRPLDVLLEESLVMPGQGRSMTF